ncbi:hypothetical protein OROGR_017770 [Orobanche gracilis]
MGISPDPSSSEGHNKQKVAMGYPSMDRYNQAQYMFPPQPPVYPIQCGPGPQGYAASSPNHNNFNQPYTSSTTSYHFPYQTDPKYLTSNDFYHPQQHYKPLVPEPNGGSSFGRVMLVLIAVLVASMCMMTIVMWLLFGTYIPEFEVQSLKISNFTVTNTTLTGEWDVDIAVSNMNKELAVSFDRVMSSVYYKEALLGISAVETFQVPQMQREEFNFTLLSAEQTDGDNNRLQSWVLPMLAHDHSNGVVVFSLRLSLKANFTTPSMVYRQEDMRVLCENMQVMFSTATGEGKLSHGLGTTCLIRISNGLKWSTNANNWFQSHKAISS